MAKSAHIPVHIDNATYNRLKAYSTAKGQPITKVVAEAVTDWLETIGAARLVDAADESGKRAKLLNFESAKPAPVRPESAEATG